MKLAWRDIEANARVGRHRDALHVGQSDACDIDAFGLCHAAGWRAAGGELTGGHRDSTPVSSTHVKSGGPFIFWSTEIAGRRQGGQPKCKSLRLDAIIAKKKKKI